MVTTRIADDRLPLLGAALGDALGAGVEGGGALGRALREDPDGVGRRFFPYSPFGFAPGELTDDTQLAWTAFWALSRAGRPDVTTDEGVRHFLGAVGDAFRAWLSSGPPDVGGATYGALSRPGSTGGWVSWGGGESAGNGSLMRATAPFVAGYRGQALLLTAALDSSLTHPDPRCVAACVFYSAALERLSELGSDADPRPALAESVAVLAAAPVADWLRPTAVGQERIFEGFVRRWPEARALVLETVERAAAGEHVDCLVASHADWPTGYVIDTLSQGVWAAVAGADAADAVRLSVVHGGRDADSIGAVAGGLAGARFGREALGQWDAELLGQLRFGHRWPGVEAEGRFVDLLRALPRPAGG